MVTTVVICLKNRTFAVSQTTHQPGRHQQWCCDLLEKSYFCSIANNLDAILLYIENVVICLKNRTFAVSQTTASKRTFSELLLWFAWKIVLLQYRKQRQQLRNRGDVCCDLLEKSYFCSIANNRQSSAVLMRSVVICLKNRTFAVSQTTQSFSTTKEILLWFAWKIVLLQYRKQLGIIQKIIL